MPAPALALESDALATICQASRQRSPSLACAELRAATGCNEVTATAWLAHQSDCAFAWPLDGHDEKLLQDINQAFADVEKPEHFVDDHNHCPECAEHDATLCAATRDTLSRSALGCSGYDPINFCNAQGMAYCFPVMARFAMLPDMLDREWYGSQLLWHLSNVGVYNRFLQWCTPRQREAVVALLHHLGHSRATLIQDYCCDDQLLHALMAWDPSSE